jgi:hypothetical protein
MVRDGNVFEVFSKCEDLRDGDSSKDLRLADDNAYLKQSYVQRKPSET